jgi:hypothetical protein
MLDDPPSSAHGMMGYSDVGNRFASMAAHLLAQDRLDGLRVIVDGLRDFVDGLRDFVDVLRDCDALVDRSFPASASASLLASLAASFFSSSAILIFFSSSSVSSDRCSPKRNSVACCSPLLKFNKINIIKY